MSVVADTNRANSMPAFEMDAENLRRRVSLLEKELLESNVKLQEHSAHSSVYKHNKHAHHIEENVRLFGPSKNLVFVDPERAPDPGPCNPDTRPSRSFWRRYNVDTFIKRPVLHQWLQDGKIYREATDRVSSRFELFFDLLFVGLVHQIAESAAEQPNGIGLVKYVLTFAPAYSIWSDVRDIVNQFSNDDVSQRCYILWIMVLLVGYSNNGASVDLQPGENGELSEASARALNWALGFFVVAKFSKVVQNMYLGVQLPLSLKPLLVNSSVSALSGILFLIAMFVPLTGVYVLIVLGILLEYILRSLGVLLLRVVELTHQKKEEYRASRATTIASQAGLDDKAEGPSSQPDTEGDIETRLPIPQSAMKDARKNWRIPAIGLEHHLDRLGAFVTILLGEMVVNTFFNSANASGVNEEVGRAMLGLMLAFNLNWMYFDSGACNRFVHALRRHWVTAGLFNTLHLPLSLALLLASSALGRLVTESEVPDGIFWYFGSGVGVAVCVMAAIGYLHKSLDKRTGVMRITRECVITMRFVVGMVMALLPLKHSETLTSLRILGIYVGLTAFLIAVETVSRLEERERAQDEAEGDARE